MYLQNSILVSSFNSLKFLFLCRWCSSWWDSGYGFILPGEQWQHQPSSEFRKPSTSFTSWSVSWIGQNQPLACVSSYNFHHSWMPEISTLPAVLSVHFSQSMFQLIFLLLLQLCPFVILQGVQLVVLIPLNEIMRFVIGNYVYNRFPNFEFAWWINHWYKNTFKFIHIESKSL